MPTCKNNEARPFLALHTKVNLKWMKDQNLQIRTIKLDENTQDIGFGNSFTELTPKAQATKSSYPLSIFAVS